MKTVWIIFSLILLTHLHGQNSNSAKFSEPSRVYGDTIIIFSGETLFFDAVIKKKFFVGFKEKKTVVDSSKTLIISLDERNDSNIEDVPSILTIYNPFNKMLFYKANIKNRKKGANFISTAVLPIAPKEKSHVMLPNPIEVIRVFNLILK